MKKVSIYIGIVLLPLLALASCNMFSRDSGIEYLEEEVFVYEEDAAAPSVALPESRSLAARGKGNKIEDFEYQIMRKARVLPVVVDGTSVQANDVVMSGTTAYVAYNTAGPTFAGAVQVIDFSDIERPLIVTEIALPHADVNALAVTDTAIYIAGAWNPDFITGYDPAEPNRAFLARAELDELRGFFAIDGDDIDARKVILDSFAATGVAVDGGTVFASTGAAHGTLQILSSDLTQTNPIDGYPDIRHIAIYHGGLIALQGTDQNDLSTGRVLVFKGDGSLFDTLPIDDFGSPEAKATIEVYDNHYAFLGLSEGGFTAIWLKDDADPGETVTTVFEIENPSVDWSSLTSTNSASYSGDLVFTANGEAGFRVFRVLENLKKDRQPDNFGELVGFVPFDETDIAIAGEFWSANHIEYRDEVLIVASGRGGVNIYSLTSAP